MYVIKNDVCYYVYTLIGNTWDTTVWVKVCQWQVGGFIWFPPPIKLTARYNWNIVESGIKHHNPNPYFMHYVLHVPVLEIQNVCNNVNVVSVLYIFMNNK